MTDLPAPVERELDDHDAFARTADGYDLETTVFDVSVAADSGEGNRDGVFVVTVSLPALSTAAADDVADVVEDDWLRTFERRLDDAFSVAKTATHEGPRVEREDGTVRVQLEYVAWDAREGVEDAKALVEYVEGTYAQGMIPGYEYRGLAATLLDNARTRGDTTET